LFRRLKNRRRDDFLRAWIPRKNSRRGYFFCRIWGGSWGATPLRQAVYLGTKCVACVSYVFCGLAYSRSHLYFEPAKNNWFRAKKGNATE